MRTETRRRISTWGSRNAGISLIKPELLYLDRLAKELSTAQERKVTRSELVRMILADSLGEPWTRLANAVPQLKQESVDSVPHEGQTDVSELPPASCAEKPDTEPVESETS